MSKQSRYLMLWDSYLHSVKAISIDGNLDAAKTVIKSALDDASDYGELDERLEWCIYGLADEYCARGDHTTAKQLYLDLLEVKEKVLGLSHPNVQAGLEKLAIGQFHVSKINDQHCSNGAAIKIQHSVLSQSIWLWKKITAAFKRPTLTNLVNTAASER